ncbi:MAG: FkbM family methyltransferase [Janthinobacterium lividum]
MILDVGANEGDFALALALGNPDIHVLAFEPIPTLAASIVARAAASNCRNLSCRQIAIDETSRQAVFHIADHHDRGVSSLMDFDKSGINANDYWRDRGDLYFSYDLNVQVSRLDDVLAPAPPSRIRFIKIDAQGVDLAVLHSLGNLLDRVEAGMFEVPATRLTRLYEKEDVDLRAALVFLDEHDFDVHAIKPNDPAINEFNVMFHRRGLDWRAMEQELGLRGLPLYDGRHFWHMPADRLMTPEADLMAARLEVDQATAKSVADTQAAAAALEEAATLRAEALQLRKDVAEAKQAARHGEASLAAAMHEADTLRVDAAGLRLESAGLREQREALLPQAAALQAQVAELRLQVADSQAGQAEARQRGDAMQDALARAMEASAGAYRVAIASEQEAARVRDTRSHLFSISEALQVEMREVRSLLASRQAQVDAACQDAETAREETRALETEAKLLRERIAGLYGSSSWRLTGPMRRLVRLVRG